MSTTLYVVKYLTSEEGIEIFESLDFDVALEYYHATSKREPDDFIYLLSFGLDEYRKRIEGTMIFHRILL